MTTAAPRIPDDVADEFTVTDGPRGRGGWTMVFGSEAKFGVAGKAWSTSAPILEAIAGAYAAMRADQAAAEAAR